MIIHFSRFFAVFRVGGILSLAPRSEHLSQSMLSLRDVFTKIASRLWRTPHSAMFRGILKKSTRVVYLWTGGWVSYNNYEHVYDCTCLRTCLITIIALRTCLQWSDDNNNAYLFMYILLFYLNFVNFLLLFLALLFSQPILLGWP